MAVQAKVTCRISDPAVAAARLDFSIDSDTDAWRGTPLEQLGTLLTETAQQHAPPGRGDRMAPVGVAGPGRAAAAALPGGGTAAVVRPRGLPSPATGTSLVAGELAAPARLTLTVESERLVAFGDGMETDALELTWGQSVRVGVCRERLRLVN